MGDTEARKQLLEEMSRKTGHVEQGSTAAQPCDCATAACTAAKQTSLHALRRLMELTQGAVEAPDGLQALRPRHRRNLWQADTAGMKCASTQEFSCRDADAGLRL